MHCSPDRSLGGRRHIPAAALLLLLGAAAWAQTTVYNGALGPGDAKLGKYFDTYSLQLSAGERLVATLRSEAFDAVLVLEAPVGSERENDDYGESSDARLDVLAGQSGEWRVKVTSYEEGEEGPYRLVLSRERLRLLETHSGRLETSDPVSIKGEHYDAYSVVLQERQRVVVHMESEELDSFVVLRWPQGEVLVSDDYLEESESRIDAIAAATGVCQVYATSFKTGETGAYTLSIYDGPPAEVEELRGTLEEGDALLEEHGYFEEHSLQLEQGEHLIVEMLSRDLDTLLLIQGPGGFCEINDDFNDLTTLSRIELFAEEAGEYVISTASYEPEASGAYTLRLYSFGSAGLYTHATEQLARGASASRLPATRL